jgi:hypothetical protein
VQIDVFRRDVDFTGDGPGFFDMFRGDDRFAIREPESAAVVDALDVGTADGEEDATDFHVAGVFRLGERILETSAGLGKIKDFPLANPGAFGLADAQDLDGAISLHLAHDEAGLAGADFETDVNFRATSHGVGGVIQLRLSRLLRSRARRLSAPLVLTGSTSGTGTALGGMPLRTVTGMLYLGIRLMVSMT